MEQGPHVDDRIDGHARHADIAGHPRVIEIIAAMGGKVEGDRQTLLSRRQIAAIEGVEISAVEKPAYWRMVQGCWTYMVG